MTSNDTITTTAPVGSLRTAAELAVRGLARDAGARSDLRHSLGRDVADVPAAWPYLPERLGPDAQRALVATMSLYALAHQAGRINPHQQSIGLGQAFAKLERSRVVSSATAEAMFVRLLRGGGLTQTTDRLRRTTTLLARAGAGLDYGLLAGDLYRLAFGDVLDQRRTRATWVRQRARLGL